jgi:hypothetical protein
MVMHADTQPRRDYSVAFPVVPWWRGCVPAYPHVVPRETGPSHHSMNGERHMTKLQPEDETTRALVKRFCDNIFWLRQIHYIGSELFHDDGARSLMERTAHAFFLDLNKIVVEYFLLEVAKLTDPATSCGGKRENFTVANLMESVEWPSDCLHEINRLNDTVLSFRKYIVPARNRLLAHYDTTTVVSGDGLGDFPEGEDTILLNVLEQMCNVFHKAAFGEIWGDIVPNHAGDVQELKKALKMAVAFKRLFSDSKGDDKMRLWKLLENVQSGPA